jgi:hypothetical protein
MIQNRNVCSTIRRFTARIVIEAGNSEILNEGMQGLSQGVYLPVRTGWKNRYQHLRLSTEGKVLISDN